MAHSFVVRLCARVVGALLCVALVAGSLAGCGGSDADSDAVAVPTSKANRVAAPAGSTLFTKLPPAHTGIGFKNDITYTEDTNVFTYRNYHNGGGVAIGDLNGDEKPDLYLTANQEPNRLYLNRGDWWFDDVTDAAGVGGKRAWATGVSLADVNGDGRLDIYVCNSGDISGDDKQNELYINQGTGDDGVPTFEEKAAEYGLDDQGYSTHAAFFDYDKDGDLDLYLLNNSFTPVSKFDLRNNKREVRDDLGGDKLYRNDGDRFVDVSAEAGIYGSEIGFGLGVTVGDVNRDGWPDIYVSNDFFERDYLYINAQDGTFREVLTEQMRHISLSSMGADMADLNNDALPEVFVTDMLPHSDERLKETSSFESWNVYQAKQRQGYYHQLMRNTLQRNNGDGTFSEVSPIAGVHATDWSWGALIADFDLDGRKDLFVSNGVYKDVTDQDFINYLANEETAKRMMEKGKVAFLDLIDEIPSNKIPNAAFRNTGTLQFEDVASEWGLDTPSFSNGSAYGDLDNDGDLDLVVNNLNQESFVYRNEAADRTENHSLQIELRGEGENAFGLGTQVTVETGSETVYLEQMPMRGFQSTVGHVLTAGVGRVDTVEAVTVTWLDGRTQRFTDVPTGQRLVVRQANAAPASGGTDRPGLPPTPSTQRFVDVTDESGLDFEHTENNFVDFNREPLIPKKVSTEGPALAVGDATGDGRDDVFVGGAKGQSGALYVQQAGGRFARRSVDAFDEHATSEDVGATFFDADGDGDLDLYVVSGGNEFAPTADALNDRLYLNDGGGTFRTERGRLPDLSQSGACVRAHDIDGDGDLDLFVGGRLIPWRYGLTPESVILENDGTGRFTEATDAFAPALKDVGMVTDARWADVDGDGRDDLVVAGEWMPITVFRHTGDGLTRMDAPGLDDRPGWWTRLVPTDVDDDGDVDFIAGNLGNNTRLTASPEEPTEMYVGDFDRNGYVEQILTVYRGGQSVPFVLRGPITGQLSMLRQRFPTHEAYAGTPIEEIFTQEELARAEKRTATTFSSSVLLNDGDGSFTVRPLPFEAQLSPMYAIVSDDVDGDGATDVLMAGNFYGVTPSMGRMDASYGVMLRGDGSGGFTTVPPRESGFRVSTEAREAALVDTPNGPRVVVASSNAPLKAFRVRDE